MMTRPATLLVAFMFVACATSRPERVLVVSIDGLRPEIYLRDEFETPTLKRLAASGAFAEGARPVFPSITYPNHTTIVTGVRPARHGVFSNTLFTWDRGPTMDWGVEASHIRAPTLWQRAKAAGKTAAIVRWPLSLGADADWVLSSFERNNAQGLPAGAEQELFQRYAALHEQIVKGASPEIRALTGYEKFKALKGEEEMDPWMASATVYVLTHLRPDVTFAYFGNLDHTQHETGIDSVETRAAIKKIDSLLGQIVDVVDLGTTCVIVTGDHGHAPVNRMVRINSLFVAQGWIEVEEARVKSWQVLAQAMGTQAAIYAKDKSLAPRIVGVLKEHAQAGYRVIERPQLDELGAYPDAVCAIEGMPGHAINNSLETPLVVESRPVSNHGFLPSHPEMYAGLIAAGRGVKPGTRLGVVDLVDVAPTVAQLLGLGMSGFEGRPLDLLNGRGGPAAPRKP